MKYNVLISKSYKSEWKSRMVLTAGVEWSAVSPFEVDVH